MKYFRNFLNNDECDYLINSIEGGVSIFNVESNRNLKVYPISDVIPFLSDKLDKIGIIGNPQFSINKYEEGCYFASHTDRGGKNDPNGNRISTLIINLSNGEDYMGGDLNVDGNIVDKDKGGCVMFSSDVKHSLSLIQSGVRYSAVFWLKKENIKGLITLI